MDPREKPCPKPFHRFNSSPEVIRVAVMLYVRYPLSLCNVEDLLFERGVDICHETVRLWWKRVLAAVRRRRSQAAGEPDARVSHWRWHLDEIYVRINSEMYYLWRAVDHKGEGLESYVTKKCDKSAALSRCVPADVRCDRADNAGRGLVGDDPIGRAVALQRLLMRASQQMDSSKNPRISR